MRVGSLNFERIAKQAVLKIQLILDEIILQKDSSAEDYESRRLSIFSLVMSYDKLITSNVSPFQPLLVRRIMRDEM